MERRKKVTEKKEDKLERGTGLTEQWLEVLRDDSISKPTCCTSMRTRPKFKSSKLLEKAMCGHSHACNPSAVEDRDKSITVAL